MVLRQQMLTSLAATLMLLLSANIWAESDAPMVTIQKMKFIPQEITIKKGESVHWINREKRQYHSVWFEKQGDPEPDYLFPDEAYSRHFDSVGSFEYRCGPHPEMIGVVHVVE